MKSGTFFWGTLLLSLGVFGLLFNLDVEFPSFFQVIKFWPILLIVWGISLFNLPKYLKFTLSGISGLFFSLVIISIFSSVSSIKEKVSDLEIKIEDNDNNSFNYSITDTLITEFTKFNFESGVSKFIIKDTTNKIVDISTNQSNASLSTNVKDGYRFVDYSATPVSFVFKKNSSLQTDITLNKNTVWDFDFDIGASTALIDLSDFKVRDLKIDSGVSQIELKLSDKYKSTDIDIDCGVSSIKLIIPETSDCEIILDSEISEVSIDGFESLGNNRYVSKKTKNTINKTKIYIDGGVSNFNISRY